MTRKPRIRKYPVTDYQRKALESLMPPEDLTVSEWAEKYRMLDSKTSALPGPWRNEMTPYLVGIMDALLDYETEEIVLCKASQLGGTEAILNALGYIIQQDPSPTLVVYPWNCSLMGCISVWKDQIPLPAYPARLSVSYSWTRWISTLGPAPKNQTPSPWRGNALKLFKTTKRF